VSRRLCFGFMHGFYSGSPHLTRHSGVDSSPNLELTGRFVAVGGTSMRFRQPIIMGWAFVIVSASVALGQTRGKAEDALLAADLAWEKAYAAKDLTKAVAFCDEHGSMLVPNAPLATGKEALAKVIASDFAHGNTTWHPNKVGVARSGELGYTSGTTDLTFKDPSGKTVTSKGNYLTVWKKVDGSWKVLSDSFDFE
jgi:ketosteroid isomerase-like protein